MLILSIIFLLLSNAVTLRRDKSILYSRVAIIVLLYSSIIAINSLFISSLYKGIGLYGGLFHATAITQNFHIFIFIVSAIIIQLTAFYPRRVLLDLYSSLTSILPAGGLSGGEIGRFKLEYKNDKLIDKDGEQFKIIEYPLILLFIVSGAIFLISTSDLVSIFLSIELQSYGCAPGEAYAGEILNVFCNTSILSDIFGLLCYRRYSPRVITIGNANNMPSGIADYKKINQKGLPSLEVYRSGDSHGQDNEFDTCRVAQLGLEVLSRISGLLKGTINVLVGRPYGEDCQKPFAYLSIEDTNARNPKTIKSNASITQPRDPTAYGYNLYLLRGRSIHSSSRKTKESNRTPSLLEVHNSNIKGGDELNQLADSKSNTSVSS